MPNYNLRIYDKIVHVRDVIFQLQQMLHGCEIVEFAAPWIDPADIFWEKGKQEAYDNEADETFREDHEF
jgi:hypothetical protein